MIGEAGRTRAERILDDTCVITRAAAGEWNPQDGLPTDTTTVYGDTGDDARCVLGKPREHRTSTSGGDDQVRTARTLFLPVGAGPFAAGDQVVLASNGKTYVVELDDDRSHKVLQRLTVVALEDAEGVPR